MTSDEVCWRLSRALFDGQGLMATLGAELVQARPGHVEIVLPVRSEVGQQHGFAHAGAVTSVLDTAAGCAAATLLPEGSQVLSIDFTVHLPRPALGERIRAVADVVNAGRKVTFVRAEAYAVLADGSSKLCALMTASMATTPARS